MASPPPSKPSKSRHIKAPAKKLARWARDIFSSSPLPFRSSTPAGSITPAAFQQSPGLSTSVGGSVQPGPSNDSGSLRPSVFDKHDDGSITTTDSQKPGLSPGLGNDSAPLGPLVSDKSNDGSITAAESQEPSGLSTSVGSSVQHSKDSAPLEPPVSDKGNDRLGVVWNGLQTALGVLKESSDVFPPLKSAVGGLVACLNVVQTAAGNREEYKELVSELQNTVNILEPYVKKLAEEGAVDSFKVTASQRILKSIEEEVTEIKQMQEHGSARQIFEAPQNQEDMIKRYRRIGLLFRQLQSDISLRIWADIKQGEQTALLDRLSPVQSARYNSKESKTAGRRECTAETREDILKDLKSWAGDVDGAKVYWMNGMAGTGKTTILYSLCKWLEEKERLSGNFFCSRNGSEQDRDVNNIIPTIAYQMAQYSLPIRSALCRALKKDSDASTKDINVQFERLIQQPMQKAKDAIPGGVVIVIDALDECDDPSTVQLLLKTLLEHAATLPMKFFVASRPEYVIRDVLQILPSVLRLHDIDESIVAADIKKYLVASLESISLSPSDIERLTKRAGKLFIYASTAVRYIRPANFRVDSHARLQAVLGAVTGSTTQHAQLDGVYNVVLSAALDHKQRDQNDIQNTRLVLCTVICAKEPISAQTLELLLGLSKEEVQNSLDPLQSILHVPEEGAAGPISVFHASFPEFMFNRDRSGDSLYCDMVGHNKVVASKCLDLMKKQLRFDISKPESSCMFDKGVSGVRRGKDSIPAAIGYAWRYWGEHLRQGGFTCAGRQELNDYLSRQLLGLSS